MRLVFGQSLSETVQKRTSLKLLTRQTQNQKECRFKGMGVTKSNPVKQWVLLLTSLNLAPLTTLFRYKEEKSTGSNHLLGPLSLTCTALGNNSSD